MWKEEMPLEWPTRIGRGTHCVRIWDTFEHWTQAVNKRVKKLGFFGTPRGAGDPTREGGPGMGDSRSDSTKDNKDNN
jgi:hypothetical protein